MLAIASTLPVLAVTFSTSPPLSTIGVVIGSTVAWESTCVYRCTRYSAVSGVRSMLMSTLAVADVCVLQIVRLRMIAVEVVPRLTSDTATVLVTRAANMRNVSAIYHPKNKDCDVPDATCVEQLATLMT